ncbi:MAG: hypothetical protein ACUVTL_00010 [Thermoproteota archaeon]
MSFLKSEQAPWDLQRFVETKENKRIMLKLREVVNHFLGALVVRDRGGRGHRRRGCEHDGKD